MKIIVALLLFVHGFGIAQSKSEYDLKISHQTEIKYSRFDLVVHETLTIKVNLIFEHYYRICGSDPTATTPKSTSQ